MKSPSKLSSLILGSGIALLTTSPAWSTSYDSSVTASIAPAPNPQVTAPADEQALVKVPGDDRPSSSSQLGFATAKRVAQALPAVPRPANVLVPNPQVRVSDTAPANGGIAPPGSVMPNFAPAPTGGGQPGPVSAPAGGAVTSPKIQIVDNGAAGIPSLSQGTTATPGATTVPPTLPRAVPPPVGDIATSSFGSVFSEVDFGTTQRIPRLLLREAPVREVLSLLARSAGMNVVFTSETKPVGGEQAQSTPSREGADKEGPKISLDIENESIQDVFNHVLRVAGLQANRVGRTIFVGTRLPVEARNVIVRSLRLNQVSAVDAANFLSAQGAESQIPITRITIQQVGSGLNARDVEIREPDIKAIFAKEGAGTLLLSGLSIVTDARLNSITLIGDPKKVQIATNLLTQLDARRRQVIVNVKVVDVNLLNTNAQSSSFSFGVGENFFSVDDGAAVYNFGPSRPPTNTEVTDPRFFTSPTVRQLPTYEPGGFFDFQPSAPFSGSGAQATIPNFLGAGGLGNYSRAPFGTAENPFQPGVVQSEDGRITISQPSLYQFPKQFLARLQASISSGSAKILTDPTLVVQEGQTATVALTQQVVGNIVSETTTADNLTTRTVTANIVNAGLELNVNVERIDDNGFITLTVNPKITSLGNIVNLTVDGNTNQIQLLNTRSVDSGRIRLRDGQTLILSGIIQDRDRVDVRKVPLLGDIPILGALFRSTNKQTQRQEVIVLLTPQVMDDSDRATWGYGYNPGPEVQKLLGGGR